MKRTIAALLVVLGVSSLALGQAANPRVLPVTPETPRGQVGATPAGGGVVVVRGSLMQAAAMRAGTPTVDGRPPVGSYTAVAAPEKKKFQKHDLVTVIVREDSDSSSTGKTNAKKEQDFNLALEQFIELGAFGGNNTIGKAENPGKLPEIAFKFKNDRKSDAAEERKDRFSARIQATIVDVKPNGTLVLEAVKEIRQDKEQQRFRLTGTCRADDVTIDNSVLSTQLADLKLEKTTKGTVRDATKRGWFNGFFDKINPF